jgi:maleylacetate reductase
VREAGADRILAIGGGSVIDSTKVMLQAIWYGIDDVDALGAIAFGKHPGGRYPDDWQRDPQSLRMIAVSTTLSAAEFSHRAGVTDTSTGRKLGFVHPLVAPEAVILDPAATLDTPMDLLLSTGVRSIDHAVERWCAAKTVPYSDAMARQALVMLLDALPRIHADPSDLEAPPRM